MPGPHPPTMPPPGAAPVPPRTALVFGGSGQVGAAVIDALLAGGWRIVAVSRGHRPARTGVQWLRGDLAAAGGMPPGVDAVLSCGPLDAFAQWFARGTVACGRVVAFGSTSVVVKQASADDGERSLAGRLAQAERAITEEAARRGIPATLLRPTLVYGAGRDRTLSRIASIAARLGVFALPRDAKGLRQPVHVHDLAAAAVAALQRQAPGTRTYDLPGGETLAYEAMVARTLAALSPPPRLLRLPSPLFALAAALAGLAGMQGFNAAARARMRQDLVFDAAAARGDLGYAPRAFQPDVAMLLPR